ncbi:MAG: neutral zinc metallopeptidase, partial [Acidobacteriota bacterium]
MKWTPGDRGNIEDLRGRSGGMRAVPMGIGGVVVLLVLSWATGVDFLSLVGGGGPASAPSASVGKAGPVSSTPTEEKTVDFLDAVMGDAQDTWQQLLGPR